MAYSNGTIYTELEAADVRKGTQEGFVRIITRMVKEEGIRAIILGCTGLRIPAGSMAAGEASPAAAFMVKMNG